MAERKARRSGGLGGLMGAGSEGRARFPGFPMLIDIVFVIDGGASMRELLDGLEARALSVCRDIVEGYKEKNRAVEKLRVKLLIFRDLYADENAFEESGFFTLPEEAEKLHVFMEQIHAAGGESGAKSALEALHRAIHVKWQDVPDGKHARQIIIVMTDAPAHSLDDPRREGEERYPLGVPRTLSGLQDEWFCMDPIRHRLAILAPGCWPWTEISLWSEAWSMPVQPGSVISVIDGACMDAFIAGITGRKG